MTSIQDETLPPDWLLSPIRDVTVRTSQRDPRKQPDRVFRYVDVSSVDNKLFKVRGVTSLKGSEAPSRARKGIRANDVLFATVRPTLKRVALISAELDGEIASTGYCVLRPNPDKVEPAFLYSCVLTDSFIRVMGKLERGANYPAVRDSDVFAASIPIPPLPEQRKIAAVLGLVQRAMEQQERLIALTMELKRALLQRLFTQGLRGEPQKQTEIGLVPQSWEVVKLADVCSFLSGGTPSKLKPEFWSGTIPWVSPKDMKRPRLSDVADHISEAGLKDGSALAPAGAVFVVIRGMILAKDVPVALAEVPMAFNQDMKAVIPGPRIESGFLLYALTAFRPRLSRKVGRSAHGTMTLMSSEITQFLIPLPDKDTQREVVTTIETVERRNELHRARRSALSDLFRTLLHQLMTGQVRVDKPSTEELTAP
jgi:type I restriction enzyme S subunit